MTNRVFCALDTNEATTAKRLAQQVKGHVGGLKLGLEFFLAQGAAGYRAIADAGVPIFLDVKLHDIPNTVAGAVKSLLPLEPCFITLHASGGAAMMRAAVEAAATGKMRPQLLGVTVLTSLDQKDLAGMGHAASVEEQVLLLAQLAKDNGLDGVVCSPAEVALLRRVLGPDFILMVPGIRPAWAAANDQKRVMTPKEAVDAGASHLVIGRPITAAADPVDAAKRIAMEIAT